MSDGIKANSWTPERYNVCPSCGGDLVGRIIGPRVDHQLRCLVEACGWTGNTDRLRRILKARDEKMLTPKVRAALAKLPPTKFVGYDTVECTASVVGILRIENKTGV